MRLYVKVVVQRDRVLKKATRVSTSTRVSGDGRFSTSTRVSGDSRVSGDGRGSRDGRVSSGGDGGQRRVSWGISDGGGGGRGCGGGGGGGGDGGGGDSGHGYDNDNDNDALCDVIVIEVRDSGCGIPEHDLPRVFDMFRRLDTHAPEAMGSGGAGVGLGLTLCREMVNAHGSEIAVRSKVGAGTSFSFSLACPTPPHTAPPATATATTASYNDTATDAVHRFTATRPKALLVPCTDEAEHHERELGEESEEESHHIPFDTQVGRCKLNPG